MDPATGSYLAFWALGILIGVACDMATGLCVVVENGDGQTGDCQIYTSHRTDMARKSTAVVVGVVGEASRTGRDNTLVGSIDNILVGSIVVAGCNRTIRMDRSDLPSNTPGRRGFDGLRCNGPCHSPWSVICLGSLIENDLFGAIVNSCRFCGYHGDFDRFLGFDCHGGCHYHFHYHCHLAEHCFFLPSRMMLLVLVLVGAGVVVVCDGAASEKELIFACLKTQGNFGGATVRRFTLRRERLTTWSD